MSAIPKYVYCLPFFSALSALILCFIGTSCKFLSISTTDATTPFSLDFGLWYHQSVNITSNGIVADSTCTLYPPDQPVDSAWVAARVFNLIAIILGATVLVFDGCAGCISTDPKKKLRGGSLGYLIAAFSAGMSLILLNTNICSSDHNSTLNELTDLDFSSCAMSTGGKSAIASCVLWVAAAAGSAFLHPSSRFWSARDDGGLDEPLIKEYEDEAFIYDSDTVTDTI
mmetsp:Transcript_4670/g.6827  ORF Transcript_4670/g.6827 Transcript_4670/m.6827 type:complete len:227 (-) Transcript_4670:135-815(-)|eukprot:CAMPEP_0201696778 /NCGR_PEP_ID=MMETSP0578-20130828/8325_1 /ASSEMBLY_ACC=CAM_ASM_000663 /TAXON_ID=267565 /ORGANISM="Skeletonema grethea, Strain CCMP 1804" /LENGTH=226 /DNA_ID=CAMNT_0048182807 /DNA_START=44 /DNA_END=724 /DNA_ORIENTATION=+